jgi:hypothetical protein
MTRFTSFFDKGISVMCAETAIFVSGLIALFAIAIALF